MIRGRFSSPATGRRPLVTALVEFPGGNRALDLRFLIDTGADTTILGPRDALRLRRELGIDLGALAQGRPVSGIGGRIQTRTIAATIAFAGATTPLTLPDLSLLLPTLPVRPIPSLLGRDLLTRFALFMEERTGRIVLLEPAEADRPPIALPSLP